MKQKILIILLVSICSAGKAQVTFPPTSNGSNTASYYSFGDITTTTTLTSSSPEYIRTFNTIAITLPNPATCIQGGLYRRFIIRKGDLGIFTLTIFDHNSALLVTTSNKDATYGYITNGSIWYQIQ